MMLPKTATKAYQYGYAVYDDKIPCPTCKTTVKRTLQEDCSYCFNNQETAEQRSARRDRESEAHKEAHGANPPKTREDAIARGFEQYGSFECNGRSWSDTEHYHKSPRRVSDDQCQFCYNILLNREVKLSNALAMDEAARKATMTPERIAQELEEKRIAEEARLMAAQAEQKAKTDKDTARQRQRRERLQADPVALAEKRARDAQRKRENRAQKLV